MSQVTMVSHVENAAWLRRRLLDVLLAERARRHRSGGAAAVPLTERAVDRHAPGLVDLRVEQVIRRVHIPLAEVERDLRAAIDDLPPGHEAHDEVAPWMARARRTGFGATGTAWVAARAHAG